MFIYRCNVQSGFITDVSSGFNGRKKLNYLPDFVGVPDSNGISLDRCPHQELSKRR